MHLARGQGEVVKKVFGRYVPTRFSKVGSPELILWFETGVSRTNLCKNLCLWSRNLAKKFGKLVLKIQDFFQKIEVKSLELEKSLK